MLGIFGKRMLIQAQDAERQTPASRNRTADFYRALAICFVVLGHWLMIAPFVQYGAVEQRNILALQPSIQYLTWLFQVMPVFFFVGGFANATSWTAARGTLARRQNWASQRLRRLLLPVVPPVLFWSLAAALVFQLGLKPEFAQAASRVVSPVWFLAVYIIVTFVTPLSFAVWERIGLWSVAILALAAVFFDIVGVGLGQEWVRWLNYATIWLAIHQLGFWWHRGDPRRGGIGLLFLAGAVSIWALVTFAGYPISMVLAPSEDFYNQHPPTTAILALGLLQVSLLLLLARPVNAWLRRETLWAMVIAVAQRIMTIYLWHLTAAAIIVGLALAFGGFGLTIEPGTATWWLTRPVWIAVLVAAMLPLVFVFGRFESGSRTHTTEVPGTVQVSIGAIIGCAGLALLALGGIRVDHFPGFNWVACVIILIGVFLSTRRRAMAEPRS